MNSEVKLEHKPALFEDSKLEAENKFRINEVYVGYGHIRFYLDISQIDILKYILNGAPSNFYKAGIKFNTNKKWMANLGLIYYRYHTTLEYTRELEPIYTESLKINRKEVTFHNNFTNTVGLQSSIARKWNLGNRLQFYAGVGVSTSYTMSVKGKTVDGYVVNPLTYNNKVRILSVNAGPSLGLMYPMSSSLNVELAYENNKFIDNGIFINNGISVKQQGALSINVSYKFK